jgi:hypothetical protein
MAKKTTTTGDADAAQAEVNRPVKIFRLRGVKISVFANQTQRDGRTETWHKVALARIYRDGEEWKTTPSLNRDDIPVARLLLDRAWQWVLDAEAAHQGKEE